MDITEPGVYGPQMTQKFLDEELERCMDARYSYNNYWTIDGKAVEPISEKDWKSFLYHTRGYQFKKI